MENYIETVVKKKNTLIDYVKGYGLPFLPFFVGVYVFVLMMNIKGFSAFAPLAMIACVVIAYFVYKSFGGLNVEWEYILVGTELRFSKIIDKSKRRDLFAVDLSKVESIGSIDNLNNNSVSKKYNFTSNTGGNVYYMITTLPKSGKVCILFEPDDRLLENFKTTLRGKFSV